ncbi:hypothetical protein EDO6_05921 [Paenibacillus xylanexedens]|nr:hypothetical protein EDO6_05921 [Paenibacillus xylanexedens]
MVMIWKGKAVGEVLFVVWCIVGEVKRMNINVYKMSHPV